MLYSPERTTSDQHNAAGLAGIEFIEFATFDDAETRALTNIFRALGFIKFAQHRSRQVELYRQGDINLIINHEQILVGLLISNGPGAISAQGAKGAVSADGPQTPERVQINKAMVGFLTHSGYSHGGNGFEGMSFLLEQFKNVDLRDPTDRNHGLDLRAMALDFARHYKEEKAQAKELGASGPRALPGVHHPVFKGKPVNYDPRERFIAAFMEQRGDYNIFHHYYRELVQALFDTGASPYVFCVNVDAIIASLLLALLWKDYKGGTLGKRDLETAAFTVFLYGRMIGAAAEIDDHINRGRNMDTRTPASQCTFVT